MPADIWATRLVPASPLTSQPLTTLQRAPTVGGIAGGDHLFAPTANTGQLAQLQTADR